MADALLPEDNAGQWTPPPVPRDDEGFVRDFALGDSDGIRAFFEEFGFVVVREALSPEAVARTLDEIWADMLAATDNVARDRPETWGPLSRALAPPGILRGSVSMGAQAWRNRESPALAQAFSTVLGVPPGDLLSSVDRTCFMRPTADNPEWKTASRWFHWDTNPWQWGVDNTAEEAEGLREVWEDPGMAAAAFVSEWNGMHHPDFSDAKVQGLVSLSDVREPDGGFTCVPGFHRHRADYCAQTDPWAHSGAKEFVNLKSGDPLADLAVKVPMRAGSVLIWSSALPHCNYPNDSANFRACQYIKFAPRWVYPEADVGERGRAIRQLQPPDFEPTAHGRRVFGFSSTR